MHNKVPQHVVDSNNIHLQSHGFCRSGFHAQLRGMFYFLVSYEAIITGLARIGVSSEGSMGSDLLLSSLMWLLAGFSPSKAVGWRASVPCWLVA